MGISSQINYYEKKAIDQRVRYTQKQCAVLSNQIVNNGFRNYNMSSLSGESGASIFEVEQLANNLEGRILLIDSRFKILADTYNRNCGKYLVTKETIHAMNGEEVSYRYIGDQYLQIILPIEDKNSEKPDIRGLIIAVVSLHNCNEMSEYLYDQRDNLLGIFIIITIIFSVLVALLIRNSFRRMQNELDIIAAGHQEEGLVEENFREFYNLSSTFNKIINRYKELENTRQEFVSNVSHELKTPITSMKILADSLLMQPDVPVELYEEFMNDIVHEIDRENQIITDLLTLVKMDKTQANLNISSVKINDLLEVLLKRISPIAEKRGIKIRLETMREVIAEVDEVKLSLACNNLIENAVKYNDDNGSVDVSLNADHKFFYIRVKDTGIGMSPEFARKIFDPFERERTSTVSKTQGTGLGMAITRNIIDMMGGTIGIQTKQGKGTEFIVRLPLRIQSGHRHVEKIAELEGLKALVVDDDFNTCDSVTKMLIKVGMRSEWTLSGKEAILRARQSMEMGDAFHAYIIDWRLPDMNGIEVTRQIRSLGDDTPIIILTAYDWSEIEEEAKDAGVTAFCSKPMFMSDLRETLMTALGEKQDEIHDGVFPSVGPEFKNKHILLVEDNELNREIALEILTNCGFCVDTAENGVKAVEKVKNSTDEMYDLVLMDIQMPVMDGYEATRQIRAIDNLALSRVPIIAMTANAFSEDKQTAISVGMNGHVAKPIDINALLPMILKYIK